MANISRPWNRDWRSYGCALAYMKALVTAQLVLAVPCIVAQILLFLICDQQWQCIVFPSSVAAILYLVGGIIGIISLAKRQRALMATYLVTGNAAVLAQVILAILSRDYIHSQFWALFNKAALSLPMVHAYFLLVLSTTQLMLFVFSTLTILIALSRFNPAFKDRALGFKTSTIRRKEMPTSGHLPSGFD